MKFDFQYFLLNPEKYISCFMYLNVFIYVRQFRNGSAYIGATNKLRALNMQSLVFFTVNRLSSSILWSRRASLLERFPIFLLSCLIEDYSVPLTRVRRLLVRVAID